MPRGVYDTLTPEQRRERASIAARARWAASDAGIDERIDALAKRAPAMTAEQAARLRVILDSVDARIAS